MKIGCGEWGFRELGMEEHFKICRDFGIKTMEIGFGGDWLGRLPVKMSEKEIQAFKALRANYKVATPFCCLENDFTLSDGTSHQKLLANVLEQIHLAKKLDAVYVRLFAGFTPVGEMTEALWQQMFSALRTCDELCKTLGMRITIETHGKVTPLDGALRHEHTVTTDRTALQRFVTEIPASIGMNYDPGNIKAVAPDDHRLCLDILNGHINYCHLKDWRRKAGGWEACAPGDDDLNYRELLPKIQFDGIYLIEYEPTADIVDGIRRSLTYLKRFAGKLLFP